MMTEGAGITLHAEIAAMAAPILTVSDGRDLRPELRTQVQALDSRNQLDNKEMSELLCAIPPAPSPRHEDDEDDDYDRSCRCC